MFWATGSGPMANAGVCRRVWVESKQGFGWRAKPVDEKNRLRNVGNVASRIYENSSKPYAKTHRTLAHVFHFLQSRGTFRNKITQKTYNDSPWPICFFNTVSCARLKAAVFSLKVAVSPIDSIWTRAPPAVDPQSDTARIDWVHHAG